MFGTYTSVEELLDYLEDPPTDWHISYNIAADWLEEQGEEKKAACLRWLAENDKQPYDDYEGCNWTKRVLPQSNLPDKLFDLLVNYISFQWQNYRPYSTWKEAMEELFIAWEKQ